MPRVKMAESFMPRLLGLMGRSGLEEGTGMYFPRCSSIHMLFMRFAIDAVYFDSDKEVVKIVSNLKPWRFSWCPGASSVLEAPAGWADQVRLTRGTSVMLREPGGRP